MNQFQMVRDLSSGFIVLELQFNYQHKELIHFSSVQPHTYYIHTSLSSNSDSSPSPTPSPTTIVLMGLPAHETIF